MRRPTMLIVACLVVASAMLAPTVAAAPGKAGFKTSHPPMLTPVMADVEVDPLITVGDILPSGYRFEAIPDGISLRTVGQGRVDVYVNHETSKAPFPFVTAGPTVNNSENDFDNSQVSRLVLNRMTGGILNGSFAIPSSAGFHRFCSNFLATAEQGFDRDLLLTNEEAIDYVFRQEDSWPPPIGDPDEKQAGLAVALDVRTGQYVAIPGMGRHNHENSVAIPGFEELVVMSGDDTFTSGSLTIPPGGPVTATSSAAQSQLFSYIADDTDSLLADEGELWAFVSDDPTAFDDYYDFVPGSTADITGEFVPVPKDVATGLDTDGSELKAVDEGFPLPPTNGSWQRDIRTTVPTGLDGPQWVLEYWSQANDVFDFVRVEDIAYDKRPGMENVVYIVDSGRGQALTPGLGISTNGRIWRMELDPNDPTQVLSLRVFLEGDDSAVKTFTEIHQPDNVESTPTGLIVTEDPGSAQQFPVGSTDTNATTGRLMFVPFTGPNGEDAGAPEVVARVDQSEDGEETDVDGRPDGNLGAWESSGIVDASQAFGPGWFLVDVQAHTLWVEKAPGFDTFIDANSDPDFTFKREGGQLLLIYIPAAIPD